MQIDRIYYPVTTLGYGKRIGIWTIGCSHHCYNCSNPELWNDNPTKDVEVERLVEYIKSIPKADGITITGGDPFDQPEELLILIKEIKKLGYEDILVYTGYTFDELLRKDELYNKILTSIGVLVDGRYIDQLNDNRSFRGSSNQKIIVINQNLKERYIDAEKWERKTQITVNDNFIQAIGLPIK